MTAKGLLLAIGVITLPGMAAAQQQSVQLRLNNYSHQSLICGIYYKIAAQCIKNRGSDDSIALGNRYDSLSSDAVGESYETGKLAGVSEKALLARSEIASREMARDIEGKCVNISVLNLKHGDVCRQFIESREATLNSILRQMQGTR